MFVCKLLLICVCPCGLWIWLLLNHDDYSRKIRKVAQAEFCYIAESGAYLQIAKLSQQNKKHSWDWSLYSNMTSKFFDFWSHWIPKQIFFFFNFLNFFYCTSFIETLCKWFNLYAIDTMLITTQLSHLSYTVILSRLYGLTKGLYLTKFWNNHSKNNNLPLLSLTWWI